MSVTEITANVRTALHQKFDLHLPERSLDTIGPLCPGQADVFLAHQIKFLAQAVHELDLRIERILGA